MLPFRVIVAAIAAVVACTTLAQPPCVPAPTGTTAPWDHNGRILDSFKADKPAPQFIGSFMDASEKYWVKLWRDQAGYFGEMSFPVLDADSPTSRLYDVSSNQRTGALSFTARLPEGHIRFNGKLSRHRLSGTFDGGPRSSHTMLIRSSDEEPASWASRAQFECAMTLWRRY